MKNFGFACAILVITRMTDLKDIYQHMLVSRGEKKKINDVIRDVFAQSKAYQEVIDELKALKEKKARLEQDLRSQFVTEMEQIDKFNADLRADAELLTDLALTKLMKGETVEIIDEHEVTYEPVFKVSFKKSK